jgi:hypothetical protein
MKKLTLILILLFSIKNLNAQKRILKTQQDTTDLIMLLGEMSSEDQKYRGLSSDLKKKNSQDTIERKRINYLWKMTDSLNQTKLDSLVNIYGIETVSSIGKDNVFIIVQHGPLEMQLRFLPVFKKLHIENGFITGQELALLEDRLLVRTLQKQIYGTQICTNRDTKEQFVCAMENPDYVNVRRLEMGINMTLGEYCNLFNFKWNLEEYKKRLPEFEAIQKKQGKW